jgi:uncharacterized protein YdaU (DUF1376 family)
MKRPWMPLYIADFLRKTTHLGALESGAYLHLIMDYWQNDALPNDERQLARIAKLTDREWRKSKAVLQAFFYDGWKHKRIDEEIAHAADVSGKRAAAAATREASKRARDMDQTEHGDGSNDPSNDPTLHTTQRKKVSPDGAGGTAYAFESGVIRLNQRDFDGWTQAYSHLELRAELLHLSEWAGSLGAKRWYHAVQKALANKNREVKANKDRIADQGGFKWNGGIEGVI